jgi:hypothetical protein
LGELVKSRRAFGSTDPRDLVFAHMGVSRDADTWDKYLEVNYEATCGYIYGQTARYMLERSLMLSKALEDIFSHANDVDASEGRPGLPSWASD